VPRVVVDDVHVLAGPTLSFAVQEADLAQELHGPRDGRGADRQRLGELGGGHPAVLVDDDGGEDAGRQAGEPGVGQRAAHPLDEPGGDGRLT
jgi:hypothetical protein